jgi:hypothetical protein
MTTAQDKARAAIAGKADIARGKIEAARRDAEARKQKRLHPTPQFYQMPKSTGDPEVDSAADLNELQKGFAKRAKDEVDRFRLATDSEYWACLCFQTREQKDHFLQALKLIDLGDKYLDGQLVAERLGVLLPEAKVPYNTSARLDPKLVNLTK